MVSIGAWIVFAAHLEPHSFEHVEVPLRTLPSFPLARQVTSIARHNATRLNSLLGFTALAVLQLGSYGRKM